MVQRARVLIAVWALASAVLPSPAPAALTVHVDGSAAGSFVTGPLRRAVRRVGIVVPGDLTNQDCRTGVCQHNENTNLLRWRGDVWLVHRTANSQILGPNSSLRVYRSRDGARSFTLEAIIPAPVDRDIRDPSLYVVGDQLHVKAITRVTGVLFRDTGVDSITVGSHSDDGVTWSPLQAIGPVGWSFWTVRAHHGEYFSAAYQDGDLRVVLYRSRDGVQWTAGPEIYGVSADTPLETELVFTPSGRLLALVRMDGTDFELLGHQGRQRTKICWARPPYDAFTCPAEFQGARLDGPAAFLVGRRLFVVARKHLVVPDIRKRTALYEITGKVDGGPLALAEWGELPSAGDTSYAGVARVGRGRVVATWYSSPPETDASWITGFFSRTDVWQADLLVSHLAPRRRPAAVPQVDTP